MSFLVRIRVHVFPPITPQALLQTAIFRNRNFSYFSACAAYWILQYCKQQDFNMPIELEPKEPKETLSVRLSVEAIDLLRAKSKETGLSQSAIVDQCVLAGLSEEEKGTRK